jgi:hypothetical protein
VQLGDRIRQIERIPWRGTLAGCRVTLCEHLEGGVSIVYGPHVVGCYTPQGEPLGAARKTAGCRPQAAPPGARPGPRVLAAVPAGTWGVLAAQPRRGPRLPLRPKRSPLRAPQGFAAGEAHVEEQRQEQ